MGTHATESAENGAVDAPSAMEHPITAKDRLIVALDFSTGASALEFVNSLEDTCRWFKVGLELFCAAGPAIIHTLRDQGFEVFLDLKLHDIPNTVACTVRSVSATGASLLTVHAAGGERMMTAAVEAALGPGASRLLAVTVLTSMDAADLRQTGVAAAPADHVERLALLAQRAGIHGMVCSPEETSMLRRTLKPEALLVVPGIRRAGANLGDQRRVATPASAVRSGASMLVVGRPITQAEDPAATAASILQEIEAAGQAVGAGSRA